MGSELWMVGGHALTMNSTLTEIPDAVIQIRDGKIVSIRSDKKFAAPAGAEVLSAHGMLIMPGLINGHTHQGMGLLRGVGDDLPLMQWLQTRIFPLERKWSEPNLVYLASQLTILEMIRNGTTTFNDMYYHEEQTARAAQEAGVRSICGQTIIEISGVTASPESVLGEFDNFLEKMQSYPLAKPAIAPHSVYGLKRKTWEKVIRYAIDRNIHLHTHLCETEGEIAQSLKEFGKTPTEVFDELGLWQHRKTIVAHATVLNDREIEILGTNRVGVSHNPESNLKLETKICPVAQLRKAGAAVAIGTDGVASNNNLDLFQEADFVAKLSIFRDGVGALTAPDVVKMLTCEGARALSLDSEIGTLEVGKAADVIAIDLNVPHAVPMYSAYSHVVFSASGADVRHSVIDGKVVMRNGKVMTIDEAGVLNAAREVAQRIRAEL